MKFEFSEEEELLRKQVRQLGREKLAPLTGGDEDVDRPEVVSQVQKAMAGQGLFELFVPEEYGGRGIKSVCLCIVREELSKFSSVADGLFAELGLGIYGVNVVGREEQKRKYLPRVGKGEVLASFAMSEPDAGSDVAAMQSTAKIVDGHYVLNGEKVFATLAGVADIYTVFAKTDPSKGRQGISAFIVERGTEGVEVGKMAMMAGVEYTIKLTDCRVPKENLIGNEGDGWAIGLGTLDLMRVTVGAEVLGKAQAAYEDAWNYAHQRVVFGRPLVEYQVTQFKLADMATSIEAARWIVYHAAYLRDEGKLPRTVKYASMAKLFATEAASRVIDEAVQIHGGSGVTRGVKVEALYREVRLPRLYEGTSEIQRLTIFREMSRGY